MPFDSSPGLIRHLPVANAHLRRDPRARYSVPTNNPTPAQQVADQVRSSSGYTLGVATADGPRLRPIGARRAAPRVTIADAVAEASLPADRCQRELLVLLMQINRAGEALPGLKRLANRLGAGWHSGKVADVLHDLVGCGHIEMSTRRGDGRSIRLLPGGGVLVSERYRAAA